MQAGEMKIVLDMDLSPVWNPFLTVAGYEVKHWRETGAITAADIEIMQWARNQGYTVFTHDDALVTINPRKNIRLLPLKQ